MPARKHVSAAFLPLAVSLSTLAIGLTASATLGLPLGKVLPVLALAALASAVAALFWRRLALDLPASRLTRDLSSITAKSDFSQEPAAVSGALGGLPQELAALVAYSRRLIDSLKRDLNGGIETSELLSMNADFGRDRTREVEAFLRQVREEFSVLEAAVSRVDHAFREVDSRIAALEQSIAGQAKAIDEDTLAVKALIGRLREGAVLAKEQRASTQALSAAVETGGARLKATLDLVRGVEADAGRMLELISVIDAIAESTNTLSINASVQAARAGEAGKGFAVVAKEIRGLAEGARRNSDDISRTLGATIDKIRAAAEAAGVVEGAFQDLRGVSATVAEAFGRIDRTMGGLAEDGDASLGIVEKVRASTEAMRGEYAAISRQAGEAGVAIGTMRDSYAVLSGDTGEIEANARDLGVISEALHGLGSANEARIRHVAEGVMPIRTWAGRISLTLPAEPNNAHVYYHELLRASLEGIGVACDIKVTEPLPQNRILEALSRGEVDCYWLVQTSERDRDFVPVEVVLSRGLVGKRVLFIPKGSQREYDGVESLRDFKRLGKRGGFGAGWFDVKVWRANGLEAVEQEGDWRELFRRVAGRQGVDYLSRGANEIIMEAPLHPELDIERRLLFVYIRNLRYYLSRRAEHHRPILENAVRQALFSGTMDGLMQKYFPAVFDPKGLDIEGRRKIKLVV